MDQTKIVLLIAGIRKSILRVAIALAGTTLVLYFLSPFILRHLQDHLDQDLAFFGVAEPFVAHIKLAFFATLFLLVPLLASVFWRIMARPFKLGPGSRLLFTLFTCLLFYGGAIFCYQVTLPFGTKFLLSYQSTELRPVISIDHFVNFVSIFVLAFGLVFELPLFMVFLAKVGICPRSAFERNRRYAVLVIAIVAAVLTPTPDVFNMALMGVPLYLLYEMGIVALRLMKIC
ncbi:MAG: twin-arginine translocase subunit TatC [Desulfobacteraceae bacterium]|nr:twin-arginine translocase subunit TatC [Desulfobacteraceae bacterium]